MEDAKQHGAKIVNEHGGEYSNSFFYPAVLYPVNDKMKIYAEEQFGPVVPIVPFDDDDEAIEYVVNSNFGQQVSIFGRDSKRVANLMDAFVNQVGRINLNTQSQRGPDTFPFNGRKDSAEGTLSVADALRVFSIRTIVATRSTEDNKQIISNIIRNRESAFLSTDYIFMTGYEEALVNFGVRTRSGCFLSRFRENKSRRVGYYGLCSKSPGWQSLH